MRSIKAIYALLQDIFPENSVSVEVNYGTATDKVPQARYHAWVYYSQEEYENNPSLRGTGCKYSANCFRTLRELKKQILKDFPGAKA